MAETATTGSAAPAAPTAAAATEVAPIAAGQAAQPATDTATSSEQKFKVKVDGKEVEVGLAELQKHYGLEKASQKRLQEVAAKEKQLNDTLAKLRDDPESYFAFAEKDPEEYAIQRLSAKHKKLLEEERIRELSPEQREAHELKLELDKLRGEKDKAAAEQKAARVGETKQRIVNAVISTLESFPEQYRKNDSLALQVFATWEHAVENYEELAKAGVKLTPEYVRDQVLKSMRGLSGDFMGSAADDELDSMIPAKAMERIKKRVREELAKEAKDGAHPSLSQDPQVRKGPEAKKQPPRLTSNQLLRRITLGTA